jgi:Holliday junction resolvase RusA-like endonuclease
MTVLCFAVRCIPPTANHQSGRAIVKVGRFMRIADKPKLVAAKGMLDGLLMPYQPATPLEGALGLTLDLTWPWRGAEPKKRRVLGRVPHTARPDADNIAKTIADRLVALRFVEDDSRIADLHIRKWWGDEPGIAVEIRRVE